MRSRGKRMGTAFLLLLGGFGARPAISAGIPVGTLDARRSIGEVRAVVSDPARPVLVFSEEDYVGYLLHDNAALPPGRFVQVVPLESGVGEGQFRGWHSFLRERYGKADRFAWDNGVIRGRAGYDNVAVTGLDRPREWPRSPVLVIDSGFFPPVYKDEVRTPTVPLVLKLYATLRNAGVEPVRIWIVDGTSRDDFPLEFGYIPDLLKEVFSDPDRFRDDVPEKWRRVDAAQQLAFFGQKEEALRELESLARDAGDPSFHYQAATIRLREGDVEGGISALSEAATRNPVYARGFLLQAGMFWEGGDLEIAEAILRGGRKLFPADERFSVGIARLLVQRAVHVLGENPDAARILFEEAAALPLPPEIRKEIVAIWAETGAFEGPVAPRGQAAPGAP